MNLMSNIAVLIIANINIPSDHIQSSSSPLPPSPLSGMITRFHFQSTNNITNSLFDAVKDITVCVYVEKEVDRKAEDSYVSNCTALG